MERTVQGTIIKDHPQDQDKEEILGVIEEDRVQGIIGLGIMKTKGKEEIAMIGGTATIGGTAMIGGIEKTAEITERETIVTTGTAGKDKKWIIRMGKGIRESTAIEIPIRRALEDQLIEKRQEKDTMSRTEMSGIEVHMIAGGSIGATM